MTPRKTPAAKPRARTARAAAADPAVVPATRRTVIIENVEPAVDGGRYAVKREVGDRMEVSADIFREGNEVLAAFVRYRNER
jgi:starch synthase (maltosyl-transferring)